MIAKAEIPHRIEIICTKLKQIKLKFLSAKQLKSVLHLGVGITSTPETVLHHGFRGFVMQLHHFSASPTPKPPAVNLTFRSTEKHYSYAVYKLTYRLGYSIIILIRVCLKSGRQKITDTKSCKRKDDTVDIRRFIFSVLLYGSVLYSIFHLP